MAMGEEAEVGEEEREVLPRLEGVVASGLMEAG
jgi:hypothetical protein